MENAFTQTRKFMMAKWGLSEFEAWTIITQAVNFGVTQLVDGNWGIHAVIPKAVFEGVTRNPQCDRVEEDSGATTMSTLTSVAVVVTSLLFIFL